MRHSTDAERAAYEAMLARTSTELVEATEAKRLRAENAKLRELVRDLWEYIYIGTARDGQELHDRTRELGAEVGA